MHKNFSTIFFRQRLRLLFQAKHIQIHTLFLIVSTSSHQHVRYQGIMNVKYQTRSSRGSTSG